MTPAERDFTLILMPVRRGGRYRKIIVKAPDFDVAVYRAERAGFRVLRTQSVRS